MVATLQPVHDDVEIETKPTPVSVKAEAVVKMEFGARSSPVNRKLPVIRLVKLVISL